MHSGTARRCPKLDQDQYRPKDKFGGGLYNTVGSHAGAAFEAIEKIEDGHESRTVVCLGPVQREGIDVTTLAAYSKVRLTSNGRVAQLAEQLTLNQ